MTRYFIDRIAKYWLFSFGIISFFILLAIGIFVFLEGLPALSKAGLFDFLFGTKWYPAKNSFGILPMIVGSIYATLLAMVIAIPLGLGCAIFLAEVAPRPIVGPMRSAVDLLVGIPSVVYGLIGMVVLVPLIRELGGGGSGSSVLAASIVLAVMILPTFVGISEDSLRAVPLEYKEGALALGATQWQTIWQVILPCAKSGIVAAATLSAGRAIGETMAMIMVIGNTPIFPLSPLDPARTLTGNIAVEIMAAAGIHESALFATGIVLFVLIMGINSTALFALRRPK